MGRARFARGGAKFRFRGGVSLRREGSRTGAACWLEPNAERCIRRAGRGPGSVRVGTSPPATPGPGGTIRERSSAPRDGAWLSGRVGGDPLRRATLRPRVPDPAPSGRRVCGGLREVVWVTPAHSAPAGGCWWWRWRTAAPWCGGPRPCRRYGSAWAWGAAQWAPCPAGPARTHAWAFRCCSCPKRRGSWPRSAL